jgi:hypothetical protein
MADDVQASQPSSVAGLTGPKQTPWRSPPAREVLLAFLGFLAVAAATLGPWVLDGGFYLDDWADAAGRFYPPGGPGFDNVMSYFYDVFEYRPVLVVFTPVKYYLFGADVSAHLAWTVLLGVLAATMLYGILRMLRLPWYHALLVAALTIVYPWFDSIRLWESANPPPLSICFALGGIWIALVGVTHRSWRLHACAAVLYLLSILAYEITLPLIALAGLLYVLLGGWEVARWRWAVDLVVVVIGGVWVGTHTTRSVSGVSDYFSHLGEMASGAETILARTLDPLGPAPHTTLVLLLAGGILVAGVAVYFWRRREGVAEGEGGWGLREWLLLAAAGLAVTVLGWAIFIPADPYYTPSVFGITNRVNALAGYGLVIAAYATIGIAVWLATAAWPAARRWAPLATVAFALVLGAAYIHVLERHVGLWQTAYDAQKVAIDRIKREYPRLPPETTLFTSGYPAYQTLGVAIFAATWDVNGMVKLEYDDGTLSGYPVIPGMELVCGPDGVGLRGEGAPPVTAPYGRARLLDLASGAHSAPRDRRQCEAVAGRYVAGPMYLQGDY